MKTSNPLMTAEAARRLTERLAHLRTVARFDQPGEPQAATLPHSVTDLEKPFHEILDSLLPKLLDESLNHSRLNDVLLEIGEELHHIQYHIKDPKSFEYLIQE